MKTLPTLQIAAALLVFLGSSGVHAIDEDMIETYCVDENDLIVDMTECNESGLPQIFFLMDGAHGGTVGGKVPDPIGTRYKD